MVNNCFLVWLTAMVAMKQGYGYFLIGLGGDQNFICWSLINVPFGFIA